VIDIFFISFYLPQYSLTLGWVWLLVLLLLAAQRGFGSQEHRASGVGHHQLESATKKHHKKTRNIRVKGIPTGKQPGDFSSSAHKRSAVIADLHPPPSLLHVSTYIGGALLQCASPLLLLFPPIPGSQVSQSRQLGSHCRSSRSTQVTRGRRRRVNHLSTQPASEPHRPPRRQPPESRQPSRNPKLNRAIINQRTLNRAQVLVRTGEGEEEATSRRRARPGGGPRPWTR
jgi:hypothetical protein